MQMTCANDLDGQLITVSRNVSDSKGDSRRPQQARIRQPLHSKHTVHQTVRCSSPEGPRDSAGRVRLPAAWRCDENTPTMLPLPLPLPPPPTMTLPLPQLLPASSGRSAAKLSARRLLLAPLSSPSVMRNVPIPAAVSAIRQSSDFGCQPNRPAGYASGASSSRAGTALGRSKRYAVLHTTALLTCARSLISDGAMPQLDVTICCTRFACRLIT